MSPLTDSPRTCLESTIDDIIGLAGVGVLASKALECEGEQAAMRALFYTIEHLAASASEAFDRLRAAERAAR